MQIFNKISRFIKEFFFRKWEIKIHVFRKKQNILNHFTIKNVVNRFIENISLKTYIYNIKASKNIGYDSLTY